MGIIVDLIIVAIVILSTFLAYRKGLVRLAIGLFSFIIAIVVTVFLYQPISNLVINVTNIDETIENAIYEKSNEIIKENETDNKLTNQVIETAEDEILPGTARNLAVNIVKGGVIIILLVAIKIALKFITALVDIIAKLPIINQINKVGGLVYGILRGVLIIYVALLILTIPEKINPKNTVNDSIDQSYLGKTMYQNNILNVLF